MQDGEDQHAARGLAIEHRVAADIDPAKAPLHMIGTMPEPRKRREQGERLRETRGIDIRLPPPERLLRPVIDRNQVGLGAAALGLNDAATVKR